MSTDTISSGRTKRPPISGHSPAALDVISRVRLFAASFAASRLEKRPAPTTSPSANRTTTSCSSPAGRWCRPSDDRLHRGFKLFDCGWSRLGARTGEAAERAREPQARRRPAPRSEGGRARQRERPAAARRAQASPRAKQARPPRAEQARSPQPAAQTRLSERPEPAQEWGRARGVRSSSGVRSGSSCECSGRKGDSTSGTASAAGSGSNASTATGSSVSTAADSASGSGAGSRQLRARALALARVPGSAPQQLQARARSRAQTRALALASNT